MPQLAWIPACAGMTEPEARRFFCQECDTDISKEHTKRHDVRKKDLLFSSLAFVYVALFVVIPSGLNDEFR